MAHRPPERPFVHAVPPSTFHAPLAQPPPGQPPVQIPYADPFQTSRDPFIPGAHGRRESVGNGRAWPSSQGGNHAPPSSHQASPSQNHPLPPPPPNGIGLMSLPYDGARRRSLGGPASPPPPPYGRGKAAPSSRHLVHNLTTLSAGHIEHPPPPPPPPPSFAARNMPPPSPPQMPPSANATQLASAPRGPPTTSPFTGIRDLATHRPGAGMSISSILGSGDDRWPPHRSPHPSSVPPTSTPQSNQPSSPGRVRSSSMREGTSRREPSPGRPGLFGEPRAQSAVHERKVSDVRRDNVFASPQYPRDSPHSFRAFRPEPELRPPVNGSGILGRPSSQPADLAGPRAVDEIVRERRDPSGEGRFATFRQFGEPAGSSRRDVTPRHDGHPFPNGVTSQPRERDVFGSPRLDRDGARPPPSRYAPGIFSTPMREESGGSIRPAPNHFAEAARESIETRQMHEVRREEPRSSPPISDILYQRLRNGVTERLMPFEESHRMEGLQREQARKESDGLGARSLLNISPELNRRGRHSPLPQAVQGAQPRHVGPGGDNPGIKMEFGRMFSGLGSGVGSTTPTAGQSVNGNTTPSRMSPARHVEAGDLVRTAVGSIEEARTNGRLKTGEKNSHRSHDDERPQADDGATPDMQHSNKRLKITGPPNHHHHHIVSHHHHHHHYDTPEQQPPGPFAMIRFHSNPGAAPSNATSHPAHHHHHHHHTTHSHPAHHHHHHAPRPAPTMRKPSISINTAKVLDAIAGKPRHHLGSQLYTATLSQPPNAEIALDAKVKYHSEMNVLPLFEGKENCTYTIRVPRYYLHPSRHGEQDGMSNAFEEICSRRQLWGSEVYTDDSDVVAAAVHSGWLQGYFGEANDDLEHLVPDDEDGAAGVPDAADAANNTALPAPAQLVFPTRPKKPAQIPPHHDLHITILILPPLQLYVSTMQHHIRSREWGRRTPHDGMSFMIYRMEFVDEGPATRYLERGMTARKRIIAIEEKRRREAAEGLLRFANSHSGNLSGGAVRVGA